MSRILFWLALAFLVLFALRSKWRAMGRPPGQQPGRPGAPQGQAGPRQAGPGQATSRHGPAEPEAETMLCCTHCGIYFPASEAVRVNGRDYCSPAHAGLPAP